MYLAAQAHGWGDVGGRDSPQRIPCQCSAVELAIIAHFVAQTNWAVFLDD